MTVPPDESAVIAKLAAMYGLTSRSAVTVPCCASWVDRLTANPRSLKAAASSNSWATKASACPPIHSATGSSPPYCTAFRASRVARHSPARARSSIHALCAPHDLACPEIGPSQVRQGAHAFSFLAYGAAEAFLELVDTQVIFVVLSCVPASEVKQRDARASEMMHLEPVQQPICSADQPAARRRLASKQRRGMQQSDTASDQHIGMPDDDLALVRHAAQAQHAGLSGGLEVFHAHRR